MTQPDDKRGALTRKHRSGVTWLDLAVEFAEETVENGPSAYIHPETAEATAQVLLALVAERKTTPSHVAAPEAAWNSVRDALHYLCNFLSDRKDRHDGLPLYDALLKALDGLSKTNRSNVAPQGDVAEDAKWLRCQADMMQAGDDKFAYRCMHIADMLEHLAARSTAAAPSVDSRPPECCYGGRMNRVCVRQCAHAKDVLWPFIDKLNAAPQVPCTARPQPEVQGATLPASTDAADFRSIEAGPPSKSTEGNHRLPAQPVGAAPSSTRQAIPEPSAKEIVAATQRYRAEINLRMELGHPSSSPSIESMSIVLHELFATMAKRGAFAVSATAATSDWNAAIEKALLACEAEQAKYSYAGGAAQAVRGALEYAMFAIRGLRRQSAFHPYCAKCEKPAPSSGGCSQADCGIRRTDGGTA